MNSELDPLISIKERLAAISPNAYMNYRLMQMDFIVHPGVFPPTQFQSTSIFTKEIPYPQNGTFWEVGCGAGVTSIVAAHKGCSRVVASDLSDKATQNTLANVKLHEVEDIVDVRCGDLFDVLREGEKFDVIYWNSNFVFVPEEYVFDDEIHRAFADPGYRTHHRFLDKAGDYLSADGKIILGYSNQGNDNERKMILNEYGYSEEVISSTYGVGKQPYRYDLLILKKI